ncbi:hypothetical protein DR864_28400 (plasmid) [Runella rosea]|uniref:Protein glutaminase domain-containing protein n=1 Tax=Runella rosea TaxID=2259595 RepID=A0A344TT26_9BACT|nr:protein-glutamine glutaminase family protein [Runella rosea]AXE21797.1 hypothetical protein DR864_28400 [Runella rosea]
MTTRDVTTKELSLIFKFKDKDSGNIKLIFSENSNLFYVEHDNLKILEELDVPLEQEGNQFKNRFKVEFKETEVVKITKSAPNPSMTFEDEKPPTISVLEKSQLKEVIKLYKLLFTNLGKTSVKRRNGTKITFLDKPETDKGDCTLRADEIQKSLKKNNINCKKIFVIGQHLKTRSLVQDTKGFQNHVGVMITVRNGIREKMFVLDPFFDSNNYVTLTQWLDILTTGQDSTINAISIVSGHIINLKGSYIVNDIQSKLDQGTFSTTEALKIMADLMAKTGFN